MNKYETQTGWNDMKGRLSTLLLIIWFAWRWPDPAKSARPIKLDQVRFGSM